MVGSNSFNSPNPPMNSFNSKKVQKNNHFNASVISNGFGPSLDYTDSNEIIPPNPPRNSFDGFGPSVNFMHSNNFNYFVDHPMNSTNNVPSIPFNKCYNNSEENA